MQPPPPPPPPPPLLGSASTSSDDISTSSGDTIMGNPFNVLSGLSNLNYTGSQSSASTATTGVGTTQWTIPDDIIIGNFDPAVATYTPSPSLEEDPLAIELCIRTLDVQVLAGGFPSPVSQSLNRHAGDLRRDFALKQQTSFDAFYINLSLPKLPQITYGYPVLPLEWKLVVIPLDRDGRFIEPEEPLPGNRVTPLMVGHDYILRWEDENHYRWTLPMVIMTEELSLSLNLTFIEIALCPLDGILFALRRIQVVEADPFAQQDFEMA